MRWKDIGNKRKFYSFVEYTEPYQFYELILKTLPF